MLQRYSDYVQLLRTCPCVSPEDIGPFNGVRDNSKEYSVSSIKIGFENPENPDLAALHDARIAFNFEGYDPADCFTPPVSALAAPDMRFRVARLDGVVTGMAALRLDDGWGEIKAVFIDPAARGCGVARALMEHLENVALAEEVRLLRLETGNLHTDAIEFYSRLGWVQIPRFDPYPENDTSLYYEKALS